MVEKFDTDGRSTGRQEIRGYKSRLGVGAAAS